MKRNKKLIKRLKARSKKNFLSVKMSGERPYVKPKKDFAKMQGDHSSVNMEGDHVFADMNGEHPPVDKK